jgi:hypothetical protein
MQRRVLTLLIIAVLVACGTAESAPRARTSLEPVTVPSSAYPVKEATAPAAVDQADVLSTLTLIAGDGRVWLGGGDGDPLDGMLAANGRTVVAVQAAKAQAGATVAWIDPATGTVAEQFDVDDGLRVTTVSSTGDLAVLSDAAGGGTAASTHIVAVDRRGGVIGQWQLPGNLVPEALADAYTPEGNGLPIGIFVIEYVRPDVYRVRVLDTMTGTLSLPLNLRDKSQSVDEAMEAIGRTAAFDPVNRLLFTLYQGVPDGKLPTTAFVHTLGLVNGVYCLDLPRELQLGDLDGALAVDPFGERLYVASPNGGLAAFTIGDILDPRTTPAADPIAQFDPGRTVTLLPTADDLFVAINEAEGLPNGAAAVVLRLDPATLGERGRFSSELAVDAMALTDDGDLVVAGQGRLRVLTVDGAVLADRQLADDIGSVARIAR